jgi:hypothetical protein
MFSTILMMCFTDVIPSIETQNMIGWVFIILIIINYIVNICFVLYIGGKQIKLIIVKYYRIFKNKFCAEKLEMKIICPSEHLN